MKALSKVDFLRVLAEIEKQNCISKRKIKYVNFDFDNRTKTFWRVVFRCWGKEYVFTTANTLRGDNKNLYVEIIKWLEGKSEKTAIE